ncbi:Endoplasmic reticulum mannosyl-oligosaccharide 1,2-alpha-mannosidase [Cytospora mali]|uniref:alpha-1,2-Mannosidase n=1 Tax=Cytospora mali TaxID=578113 RepID=A0A194VYH2_CYTMA|nr:Endoplasmic reticulum mannosyl-oligosaccharide 1,2-alpha-mannosidase [Valsa mali]
MFTTRKGPNWLIAALVLSCLTIFYVFDIDNSYTWSSPSSFSSERKKQWQVPDDYFWKTVPVHYPATSIRPLPINKKPVQFPKVQAITFPSETAEERRIREEHRDAIKQVFQKCWRSYKEKAWLADELTPVSGYSRNPFGGWGATLVDSLDTLWIMGMKDEFAEAVAAAYTIDFTKCQVEQINVFETTIRYLGGFLAAFDLSGDARLLRKAAEVGEMLYKAFDTPNRMPITRWNVNAAAAGERQEAPEAVLVAEIGSLTMEFTRLSMLTGDPKWFDAVQRITDIFHKQQMTTSLTGLWPLVVNAKDQVFNVGSAFTLGAMADSLFEYLPKMSALLGGRLPEYQEMYGKAMDTASDWLLFRPMIPAGEDILIAGQVQVQVEDSKTLVSPQREGQHLVCFVGGMFALGGKLFNNKKHQDLATKLVDGCIWTYKASQHGVMPETFYMAPCASRDACEWDETAWKKQVALAAGETPTGNADEDIALADRIIEEKRLPRGFTAIPDRRYILRPEAIESVFVLYRATGRRDLLDSAWQMFTAIDRITSTRLANSAVADMTTRGLPSTTDSMESFWMGETLKYFYLIFSRPDLVSLDEFVFNTEAHPFRRLTK